MEVGKINSVIGFDMPTKKTDKSQSVFSSKTESEKGSVPSDPLSYYRKLCKKFPNVSFRLEDQETSLKNPNKICLGYNGSMNQVGDNFGGVGHCSINMDISVIRKMQADTEYEQAVLSAIRQMEKNYSQIESGTRAAGMMYTQVTFFDDNGKLSHSIGMSNQQPSTETQIRRMWGAGEILGGSGLSFGGMDSQEMVKRIYNQMQDAMIDGFLDLTEEKEDK